MTQPCHKHTTLNQQCCDREHKRWEGGKESGAQFLHRTSPPTTNTATQDRRGTRTTRRERTMRRGGGTMQDARPNPNTGQHTTHHTPPFNKATGQTTRGTPTHRRGHRHSTGRPTTLPPFTHHATHHPLCHPTIHDGPTHHQREGGAHRGYPTTRTPQTHTHHPHTTHPAMEQCTT